jgi:hypothetical protein
LAPLIAEPLVTIIEMYCSTILNRTISAEETECVCVKLTEGEARKLLETQGFELVFRHAEAAVGQCSNSGNRN